MDCCVLHVCENTKETVYPLSHRQWDTARCCAESWASVDEPLFTAVAHRLLLNTEYRDDMVCHQSCYKKFTNKIVIARAMKRSTNEPTEVTEVRNLSVTTCLSCYLMEHPA